MQSKPVKDARVDLTDGNGLVVSSAYTNSSGSFEFSNITPGMYTVVASSGMAQSSERIEANSWAAMVALHLPIDNKPQDGVQGQSVSVAQINVPKKAREEFSKAREALEKEKTDDGTRHLAKALSIYPNYADALTLRAVLSLNHKDPEAAIADLDQAIKNDPNLAMAYLVMGSALNMQGKFDEAIASLQRGETLAPDSWQAHFEMGKAYVGKEDYSNALGHLQRAQSLAPSEYPVIYLLQAQAHIGMKQYPDALAALQSYLQKEPQGPNSAEAHKMLEKTQAMVESK
jgi:tetratricopeptide (TPR) repeat protein